MQCYLSSRTVQSVECKTGFSEQLQQFYPAWSRPNWSPDCWASRTIEQQIGTMERANNSKRAWRWLLGARVICVSVRLSNTNDLGGTRVACGRKTSPPRMERANATKLTINLPRRWRWAAARRCLFSQALATSQTPGSTEGNKLRPPDFLKVTSCIQCALVRENRAGNIATRSLSYDVSRETSGEQPARDTRGPEPSTVKVAPPSIPSLLTNFVHSSWNKKGRLDFDLAFAGVAPSYLGIFLQARGTMARLGEEYSTNDTCAANTTIGSYFAREKKVEIETIIIILIYDNLNIIFIDFVEKLFLV